MEISTASRWQQTRETEDGTLKPFHFNLLVRGWTGHCAHRQEIWLSRSTAGLHRDDGDYDHYYNYYLLCVDLQRRKFESWFAHRCSAEPESFSGRSRSQETKTGFGRCLLPSWSQSQAEGLIQNDSFVNHSDSSCPHKNLSSCVLVVPGGQSTSSLIQQCHLGLDWWKWLQRIRKSCSVLPINSVTLSHFNS